MATENVKPRKILRKVKMFNKVTVRHAFAFHPELLIILAIHPLSSLIFAPNVKAFIRIGAKKTAKTIGVLGKISNALILMADALRNGHVSVYFQLKYKK